MKHFELMNEIYEGLSQSNVTDATRIVKNPRKVTKIRALRYIPNSIYNWKFQCIVIIISEYDLFCRA